VIWRGAMKAGAIRQFLEDTAWGSLITWLSISRRDWR
jgi:hypothetical protein